MKSRRKANSVDIMPHIAVDTSTIELGRFAKNKRDTHDPMDSVQVPSAKNWRLYTEITRGLDGNR